MAGLDPHHLKAQLFFIRKRTGLFCIYDSEIIKLPIVFLNLFSNITPREDKLVIYLAICIAFKQLNRVYFVNKIVLSKNESWSCLTGNFFKRRESSRSRIDFPVDAFSNINFSYLN
jgi:hypothetical protein